MLRSTNMNEYHKHNILRRYNTCPYPKVHIYDTIYIKVKNRQNIYGHWSRITNYICEIEPKKKVSNVRNFISLRVLLKRKHQFVQIKYLSFTYIYTHICVYIYILCVILHLSWMFIINKAISKRYEQNLAFETVIFSQI